jgi:hypothetical protein
MLGTEAEKSSDGNVQSHYNVRALLSDISLLGNRNQDSHGRNC